MVQADVCVGVTVVTLLLLLVVVPLLHKQTLHYWMYFPFIIWMFECRCLCKTETQMYVDLEEEVWSLDILICLYVCVHACALCGVRVQVCCSVTDKIMYVMALEFILGIILIGIKQKHWQSLKNETKISIGSLMYQTFFPIISFLWYKVIFKNLKKRVYDNISVNIINFVELWIGHPTAREKGADPYYRVALCACSAFLFFYVGLFCVRINSQLCAI